MKDLCIDWIENNTEEMPDGTFRIIDDESAVFADEIEVWSYAMSRVTEGLVDQADNMRKAMKEGM